MKLMKLKDLKHFATNLSVMLALVFSAAPVLATVPAYAADPAACPSNPSSPKGEVLSGLGETGSNCDDGKVNDLFSTVVEIMSLVIGVVAIIVILVAGFKFMTSGGDSNKVANAKGTLIYALVGLAVAALAQFLVHFVLYQSSNV